MILALFSLCVITGLYNSGAMGTKSASLSVHRAIRRNSENIERYNIDDGILLGR